MAYDQKKFLEEYNMATNQVLAYREELSDASSSKSDETSVEKYELVYTESSAIKYRFTFIPFEDSTLNALVQTLSESQRNFVLLKLARKLLNKIKSAAEKQKNNNSSWTNGNYTLTTSLLRRSVSGVVQRVAQAIKQQETLADHTGMKERKSVAAVALNQQQKTTKLPVDPHTAKDIKKSSPNGKGPKKAVNGSPSARLKKAGASVTVTAVDPHTAKGVKESSSNDKGLKKAGASFTVTTVDPHTAKDVKKSSPNGKGLKKAGASVAKAVDPHTAKGVKESSSNEQNQLQIVQSIADELVGQVIANAKETSDVANGKKPEKCDPLASSNLSSPKSAEVREPVSNKNQEEAKVTVKMQAQLMRVPLQGANEVLGKLKAACLKEAKHDKTIDDKTLQSYVGAIGILKKKDAASNSDHYLELNTQYALIAIPFQGENFEDRRFSNIVNGVLGHKDFADKYTTIGGEGGIDLQVICNVVAGIKNNRALDEIDESSYQDIVTKFDKPNCICLIQ